MQAPKTTLIQEITHHATVSYEGHPKEEAPVLNGKAVSFLNIRWDADLRDGEIRSSRWQVWADTFDRNTVYLNSLTHSLDLLPDWLRRHLIDARPTTERVEK